MSKVSYRALQPYITEYLAQGCHVTTEETWDRNRPIPKSPVLYGFGACATQY